MEEEKKVTEIQQDELELNSINNPSRAIEDNESIIEDVKNEIINAFLSQEDEIKTKLKNQIGNKNLDNPRKTNFHNDVQKNEVPYSKEFNSNDEKPEGNYSGFSIEGDSSKISTTALDEEELEDVYMEDLVTIMERTGEHSFVLKHVDRSLLSELTEDKDYTVLIEWGKLIPNDAKLEDIDKIFEKGLKELPISFDNKKDLLFDALEIKKDQWVENLQENKTEYNNKTELEISKAEKFGGSTLVISDIISQRENLPDLDETIEFEEDFINSSIEDDLEGLSEFFGLDEDEQKISSLDNSEENELDIMSLSDLNEKSTEELIEIKERLNEQKQESSEKAREYSEKAEEIEKILKGYALRNDGSLYIGEDFFKNHTIEERGEILKEFTFKAFDDFNRQATQVIEKNNLINEEEIKANEKNNDLEKEVEPTYNNIINLRP